MNLSRTVKRWRLFLLLLLLFPVLQSSAASLDDELEIRGPKTLYSSQNPGVMRRVVRTPSGEVLDVTIDAQVLGFSLNVDAAGAAPLAVNSAETLQTAVVGELQPGAPFVLMVSRRADQTQNVVVAARENQRWALRPLASAGPDDDVRMSGAQVAVAERIDPQAERDTFYDLAAPQAQPTTTWVPRNTMSIAPLATDAGINSAEDAALHVTAFNEGSLAPWDSVNQPWDGSQGFKYGLTSGNSDGALLSFGLFQWNFWSGTLPPMLRRFEQIDSTSFWAAFNGLDVTSFRTEVMASGATVAQSYEWARTKVPGGAWLTSNGAACSGYGGDCRWIGGSMVQAWRDAFSKLGAVAAFQAEERKSAIDSYITPVKNGRYQTLNNATGRSWSLRSLLALVDFGNQYGLAYGDSTACSLNAWLSNSVGCSRNTDGSTGYSASLSDQANVKRMPFFLEPSTYRNRRNSIATGDGSVLVNGQYPAWDSYFARYNVSLNAPWGGSTAGGPPAAPSGMTSTALSSSSIKVTWVDNSNNEANFLVFRWTGSNWMQIATLGPNVTSYTDTGLQPSTTYWHVTCAQNSVGAACANAFSTAKTLGGDATPPAAPSNMAATALSSTSIKVTWNDNSNNEANFLVFRWTGSSWTQIATLGANVTSYTDTGLQPGTTYWHVTCAQNSAGAACANAYSTAKTLSGVTPPAAPSGMSGVALSSTSIKVTWVDNSNNEANFLLFRWNGSSWTQIATLGPNVTSYTDTGLQPSTTYYHVACAENSAGAACANAYSTTKTLGSVTPPAAPSGMSAAALSSTSLRVSWIDNANNESNYLLFRWNGSSWTQIATLGANVTSYTDTGLQPSTTYYHVACAQNSAGAACANAYSTATTLGSVTTPPAAPSGMSAAPLSSTSIRVSWIDNANNESNYLVFRWNGSSWTQIATLGANATSYTDTGLHSGTVYYHVACAQNSAGAACANNYSTAKTY